MDYRTLGRRWLAPALLPLLASQAACAIETSGVIVPEDEGDLSLGKADTDVRPDDEIDSRRTRSGVEYFERRSISNLAIVGAFDSVELSESVARRVDGILAARPSDGWVDLEELERIEMPDFEGSLFPEERAALDHVWTLIEAPADTVTVSTSGFTTLEDVEEVLPNAATLPDRFVNFEGGGWDVRSLQRLELQFDDDMDPTTVSLTDLEAGINDELGRYTAGEVEDFERARDHISRLRQEVLPGPASLIVPGLGERSEALDPAGALALSLIRRSYLVERQQYSSRTADTTYTMRLNHEADVLLDGDRDVEVLVILPRGENVRRGGDSLQVTSADRLAIEAWRSGELIGSAWLELPEIPRPVTLDDYFGYRLEDELGDEVTRSERRQQRSGTETITQVYSGALPRSLSGTPGGQINGEDLPVVQWGRYEVMLNDRTPVALEIWEGGLTPIVWIEDDGERYRARWARNRRFGTTWTAGVTFQQSGQGRTPHYGYRAVSGNGELFVSKPGTQETLAVRGLDRTR